jgi:acetyl esterase/lipase
MNRKTRDSVGRIVVYTTFSCLFWGMAAYSQTVIWLWPGAAPGALRSSDKDIPMLTVFVPDSGTRTGSAIVICPGGGYSHLASHEGADYGRFLSMHGIISFVLKYRLGSDGYRHPAMLEDAARAVRVVRAGAAKWHVDTDKIGIMGSSAGGHLAATLLTHYDSGDPQSPDPVERVSSRPDFGILCYPVVSMGPITHEGSRKNLLGDSPGVELVDLLSNEKHVTADMPPCFIWHTSEDKTVSVQNSIEFAKALAEFKVPFELHVFERGRHGLGLGDTYPFAHVLPWVNDLLIWLKLRGMVKG